MSRVEGCNPSPYASGWRVYDITFRVPAAVLIASRKVAQQYGIGLTALLYDLRYHDCDWLAGAAFILTASEDIRRDVVKALSYGSRTSPELVEHAEKLITKHVKERYAMLVGQGD